MLSCWIFRKANIIAFSLLLKIIPPRNAGIAHKGRKIEWALKKQKHIGRKTENGGALMGSATGREGPFIVSRQVYKKDAERKADSWKKGVLHENSDPSVAELWECFLRYLVEEKQVGTSTVDQARKFGRNYILPVCGNLRISRLNEGHLQRVLNLSAQKGCLRQDTHRPSKGPLSLKTLRGLRNIEQQFVKWCRINGYTDLVLEGLEVRTSAQKVEKEILQPNELRTLFHVDTRLVRGKRVFDEQIYSYRFAVVTGLRPGELMGLRIGDIQGDKLHVQQAINRYGETTSGKNQNARRTFGLNSFTRRIVEQQLELLHASGMPTAPDSPLFPAMNQ
ncbi:hypothetical protein SUBVAR_05561 [Subdoligranulum variabile DSM 15176]|uniref:Tyr recombinase domain-containing protein n=2 Tax=Subdoligranulum variabile TaxID=214851 RepID=D1PMK1_9FIRM|nr:hypothetical protein SUBVAR_05561 [Subdoligranulum variabile DSM 15176]